MEPLFVTPTYPSESLRFTSLVGVQPEVKPFIVKSYKITELHYTYGNATLSADYVGYLYFENYWLTPHI